MSSNVEKLLGQVEKFEKIATDSLEKTAEKLDPKAKVRNRGTVCVPAESAKDKKDHFPINNEAQARNALARVNQFSKVPDWYSGSLQGLVSLVARKVKAKYPSIEVSKEAKKPGKAKKSSEYYDHLLNKFAQNRPTTSFQMGEGQIEFPDDQERYPWTPKMDEEGRVDWPAMGYPGKDSTPSTTPAQPAQPAKPAKPTTQPSTYTFVPEIQEYQKWVIGQGSNELGAGGADGKLGPKTLKSLLSRFPNSSNDPDKALQDFLAYKAKMGYGKPATPQPGVYDPKLGF